MMLTEPVILAITNAIMAVARADEKRTAYKIMLLGSTKDPELIKLLVEELKMDAADRKFWSDLGAPFRKLADSMTNADKVVGVIG